MASANAMKGAKLHPVSDDYEIGKQLGTGKFSTVKLVVNKDSKKEYAVKMINKKICDNEELLKEVEIMRAVDENPGVIHLIDVYEDPLKFNLILELVTGGELFDKIVEYEFYSEKEASNLIFQICSIVNYLHKKGIVHRDLKPENLLFEDETAKKLKLCDFGLADYHKDGEIMYSIVGSPTYMAPEIMTGKGYVKSVDMYSIGVIMYILLCGYPPFEPEEGIIELEFPSPEWDAISQDVKDVITLLLESDPSKRPTAEQLLAHPWVSGVKVSDKLLTGTIKTMKMYNTVRRNPGATMRQKDKDGKTHVGNIFANPGNSIVRKSEPVPSSNISSKKTNKKKEKRKSQVPTKRADGRNGITFGEKSYMDLSKKMEELKLMSNNYGKGVSKVSSPADHRDLKDKELSKLKDMYQNEKTKRTQLEDKIESLEEQIFEETKRCQNITIELGEINLETEASKKQIAELDVVLEIAQKESDNMSISINELSTETKRRRETNAALKAKIEELHKYNENQLEEYIEAFKKLKAKELKIKTESMVSDRLEARIIKDLEYEIGQIRLELKKLKPKLDESSKSKEKVLSKNKSLQKELQEMRKKVENARQEKHEVKAKLQELQSK